MPKRSSTPSRRQTVLAKNQPRPTDGGERGIQYPMTGHYLSAALLHLLRGPLYASILLCFMFRPYVFPALVDAFRDVDLSRLPSWLPVGEHTTARETFFFAIAGTLVHEIMYFGLNGFFLLSDYMGWFKKYKITRTSRMIPKKSLIVKTILEAIPDHFIIQPIALWLLFTYITTFPRVFGPEGPVPPMTFQQTFGHFFMCQLFNETLFYFVHRALHVPFLYRTIHKKHHEYVGSIGFAAEYAHPLEHLFAGKIPTLAYAALNSANVGVDLTLVWILWRSWESYEAHCGYSFDRCLPSYLGLLYADQAKFHDWHHTHKGNFGHLWIDYPLGTMDSWAVELAQQNKPHRRG